MTDTGIQVLLPLQHLIDQIVRSTPIGATDQLAAELAVHTAVWVGKNVLPRTDGLARFVADIDAERQRQLAKFGDQQHPDGTGTTEYAAAAGRFRAACDRNAGSPLWSFVLLEGVYEALAETDPAKLRAELVQSGAVIAAWISDLDRRALEAER